MNRRALSSELQGDEFMGTHVCRPLAASVPAWPRACCAVEFYSSPGSAYKQSLGVLLISCGKGIKNKCYTRCGVFSGGSK